MWRVKIHQDFGIRIRKEDESSFSFLFYDASCDAREGILKRSAEEIFALARECRTEWKEAVVDYRIFKGKEYEYPYRELWDFENEPDPLKKIGARLACAGDRQPSIAP
jgi:hypothetical protein